MNRIENKARTLRGGRRGPAPSAGPRPTVSDRRRGRARHGLAVVEFAAVAPLLLVVTLGMIEYGRLVQVQQVLTNASREGARLAATGSVSASQVQAVVDSYLATAGINGETTTVSPSSPTSAGAGDPVTVSVSIPFSSVHWYPPVLITGMTMNANATMRAETTNSNQ